MKHFQNFCVFYLEGLQPPVCAQEYFPENSARLRKTPHHFLYEGFFARDQNLTILNRSTRMTKLWKVVAVSTLLTFAGAAPAFAQAPVPSAATPPAADAASAKEESSVTEHTIRVGGQAISYKATAGSIQLKNAAGEPTALMFYTAYTKSDAKDMAQRPVSFLYNGGPGSSSVWLHMGAFGPRRVVTKDGDYTPPAPYQIADNANTLLDRTDMVFIDPIGTGFSHAVGKAQNKDFWGVDSDTSSIAQFITTYVSRNDRWNSPKFLIGESYGTFRSAALANFLQARNNMAINGVVLMSSVLDLSTISFLNGQDLSYVLYLPSYAATAWYHNVVKDRPAGLQSFLNEARKFAAGEYADALMKGSKLTGAERADIAKKLSRFTGLSEDYLLKGDLRIVLPQYTAELQRSRGLTTGRLDSRFSGPLGDMLAEFGQSDPQSDAVSPAFVSVFNSYVRNELKFGNDKEYNPLNYQANGAWDWKHQGNGGFGFPGAPNTEGDLVQAMLTNPNLHIEIESGLYDLATPFFGSEYTVDHLGLPEKLQGNIKLKTYDAGHMMYLHDEDLAKLKNNIVAVIDGATKM
jgi:carboxypeptidase C (cathepsin A)